MTSTVVPEIYLAWSSSLHRPVIYFQFQNQPLTLLQKLEMNGLVSLTLPRRASSRWSPTATNNLAPCRGRQFAENFKPKMIGRKEKVGSFYLNMTYMALFGIYVRFLGIISIGNASEPTIDFQGTFVRFPGSVKSNKWNMQTVSIVCGWFTNPVEKYATVKLDHFPSFEVKHKHI